jgi:SanA protein
MRRRAIRATLTAAIAVIALGGVVVILAGMGRAVMASWGDVYASPSPDRLPDADVALVLGTLTHNRHGLLTLELSERLDAAVELWGSGRIKYLIVSGNRDGKGYEEPTVMRDVLVQRGVPASAIYRDFAGLRTVTSIVRARDIYGQKRFIVVSQRAHVDRALFLARHLGLDAWGYYPQEADPRFAITLSYGDYYARLVVLYAFWDIVIGPRAAVGPRVAIGVDPA